jgi:acyl dehydratase
MALWCEAMRDDNPIHVSAAAAEALGFGPRTVNPGPINLAYVLNMALEARPGSEVRAVEAAFLGNVLAGDAVVVRGEWRGETCEAQLSAALEHVVMKATVATERSVGDDGEGVRSQRL